MKDDVYYKSLYRAFIDSRLDRDISGGGYYEEHHIKPRVMGGTNDPNNLIMLTCKEHYFAHLILVKAYPKVRRLKNAVTAMIGTMQTRGHYSSRSYSLARKVATLEMPPKTELEYKYFKEEKSMKILGEEYDVSDMTICKWFKVYDIKAIPATEKAKQRALNFDLAEFTEDYKNLTIPQVMEKYQVSRSTVIDRVRRYDIPRKCPQRTPKSHR